MNKIQSEYEKVKNCEDPERINSFLINLSQNCDHNSISYLKHFIDELDKESFQRVKLNLIFVLGQIAEKKYEFGREYIDFLIKEYYQSDRWIRNEIIVALSKILEGGDISISNEIWKVISSALKDNYQLINKNVIALISNLNNVPDSVLKDVFVVLKSDNTELVDETLELLKSHILNEIKLFKLLDLSENYRRLNKKAVRYILGAFFDSGLKIRQLDNFREAISLSEWEDEYKLLFISEIDTYEKLFIKQL
ncbi:MAG: hypothetical protein GF383_04745 [Candidatus Lokiarchaeota archaeon]|nr:hypothetical protein [Candidatus Lokiarchaeota archaeon]MBD3339104.1 hypothetical protein [Candidatus Lokiarchaeota archaeon]